MMNMMKKMYDEGDDEMKRTIAKTWSESQSKKGGPPGGGMGGMDI
jgi:calcyclin binding protein